MPRRVRAGAAGPDELAGQPDQPVGRLPSPAPALPYGPVAGSAGRIEHVAAPGGILDRHLIARLTGGDVAELIVTPWRGVLAVRE